MRRRSYVLVALLLALLAGCGFLGDVMDLQGDLQDAGYDVERVFVSESNGYEVVQVTWDSKATTEQGVTEEGRGIARIVWLQAPFRVDAVYLIATGIDVPGMDRHEQGQIDREELERDYGPRPPGLDDSSFSDSFDPKVIVGIVVGLLVLGIAAIVLIVVLVKRTKRRNQPPPGTWAPQPGAWGQQGWQQAPPGSWGPPPAAPPAAPPPAGSSDDPFAAPPS